jgi:hypothetical protein
MKQVIILLSLTILALLTLSASAQQNVKMYFNPSTVSWSTTMQLQLDTTGQPMGAFYNSCRPLDLRRLASSFSFAYSKQHHKKYSEVSAGFVAPGSNCTFFYRANDTTNAVTIISNSSSAGGAVRLEKGRVLLQQNSNGTGWQFVLANAIRVQAYQNKTIPVISTSFPMTSTRYNAGYQVIPHLQYASKTRWGIDISAIYSIATMGLLSEDIQNPTIPVPQQKYSAFDFDLEALKFNMPLRIGLSYKLG